MNIDDSIIQLLPVLIGLVLSLFRMNLKTFQALYILGAVGIFMLHQYMGFDVSNVWLIGSFVAGEIIHFVLLGTAGSSISPTTYRTLLVAVGYYPWWWGQVSQVMYLLTALFVGIVYSLVTVSFARRKFGIKQRRVEAAKNILSEEDYAKFKRMASVVAATPLFVAALVSRSFIS